MYRRGKIWWQSIDGVRVSSGTDDKTAAKAYFAKRVTEAWETRGMGAKRPRSWQEAVVRYLKECQGQPSYRNKVAVLRWWAHKDRLGEPSDIRLITRDRVDGLLESLCTAEPSSANTTLNKKVGLLHHMLAKACEEWEWTEKTPKFRSYPEPPARERWLTRDEWITLSNTLPMDLRHFATLALATGLRSGTLVGLRWSQYDSARRVLNVSGNSQKRANPIPLNNTAVAVLEARRLAQTRHLTEVFPEFWEPPLKQRGGTWAKVRQIPGLEDVRIHDLRRTFNSWLGQAGVPREIRKKLMGHAEMDVHEVYSRWSDESLRPAVEVIDQVLEGKRAQVASRG